MNTINQPKLVRKLANFGLHDSIIHWFENYLRKRQQRTFVNDKFSEWQDTKFGVPQVPQGSILGPLLFILFVNGIHYVQTLSKVTLYAHDTVITLSHQDPGIVG